MKLVIQFFLIIDRGHKSWFCVLGTPSRLCVPFVHHFGALGNLIRREHPSPTGQQSCQAFFLCFWHLWRRAILHLLRSQSQSRQPAQSCAHRVHIMGVLSALRDAWERSRLCPKNHDLGHNETCVVAEKVGIRAATG